MRVLVEHTCTMCTGKGKMPHAEAMQRKVLGMQLSPGIVTCAQCAGKGATRGSVSLDDLAEALDAVKKDRVSQ